MNREEYLKLAKEGKRMVFGADLVIKSKPNHDEIKLNGTLLGKCIEEATLKYSAPLALPHMDLSVEKEDLLTILGINKEKIELFKMDSVLDESLIHIIKLALNHPPTKKSIANCEAISYIRDNTDYIPVGMCIGPFSMMTKLIPEPITPVFMAAMGVAGEDDMFIKNTELTLEVCTMIIERSIKMQIKAGAKAICVCEPAANSVYISPDMVMDDMEDIFDRFVIHFNQRLKTLMDKHNVDLILHDCGELSNSMLKKLCTLDPVIFSLGSSRNLWEDAAIVPDNIILFGNLPTKHFAQDKSFTPEKVEEITRELHNRMEATNHPFILGSECDILHIPGMDDELNSKVSRIFTCNC